MFRETLRTFSPAPGVEIRLGFEGPHRDLGRYSVVLHSRGRSSKILYRGRVYTPMGSTAQHMALVRAAAIYEDAVGTPVGQLQGTPVEALRALWAARADREFRRVAQQPRGAQGIVKNPRKAAPRKAAPRKAAPRKAAPRKNPAWDLAARINPRLDDVLRAHTARFRPNHHLSPGDRVTHPRYGEGTVQVTHSPDDYDVRFPGGAQRVSGAALSRANGPRTRD